MSEQVLGQWWPSRAPDRCLKGTGYAAAEQPREGGERLARHGFRPLLRCAYVEGVRVARKYAVRNAQILDLHDEHQPNFEGTEDFPECDERASAVTAHRAPPGSGRRWGRRQAREPGTGREQGRDMTGAYDQNLRPCGKGAMSPAAVPRPI